MTSFFSKFNEPVTPSDAHASDGGPEVSTSFNPAPTPDPSNDSGRNRGVLGDNKFVFTCFCFKQPCLCTSFPRNVEQGRRGIESAQRIESIEFMQINLNKSPTASRELTVEIDKLRGKPYISLVTEPFTRSQSSTNNKRTSEVHSDYRIQCLPRQKLFYTANKQTAAPRTAIFADNSQDLMLDPTYCDRDVTSCKWRVNRSVLSVAQPGTPPVSSTDPIDDDSAIDLCTSQIVVEETVSSTSLPAVDKKDTIELYVVSMYWDNTFKEPPAKFIEIVNYCTINEIPIIISSDTNAHSAMWHSKDTNPRGVWLEDFILNHDLEVLNNNPKPTYVSGERKSVIDVTMVSRSISHYFSNWRNHDKDMSTDHKLITFTGKFNEKPLPPKWNLRKAAWPVFRAIVDTELGKINIPTEWNESVIDNLTDSLHQIINKGLTQAVPLTKPKNHHKLKWWNDELAKARKNKNSCHRKYNKHPTAANLRAKIEANKQIRSEMNKASRKYWQNKTSDVSDASGMAKLVKGIRKGDYVPPTLLMKNNTYTKNREETLNLLADTHFDGCQDENPTSSIAKPPLDRASSAVLKIRRMTYLSETRVRHAISTFEDFKAPGPCGTQPIVLKNLPTKAIELLSWIYSACIEIGYVPKAWRTSKTIFIPKQGKGDYTLPRSYRPITLTSFFFKTMERLILWKLDTGIFKTNPIHKEQYAFRKGCSTEGALTKTVGMIESAIANRKLAMALFVDIEGAFDNLSTDAAVHAMKNHKLPAKIIKWFEFYLRNRSSSITLSGTGKTKRLVKGTPQGGVLSPILWNLAFDELLKMFDNNQRVEIRGFADDACLVITGDDPITMEQELQKGLDRINRWARWNGLKLSSNKTVAMIFNRTRRMNNEIDSLRGLYLRDRNSRQKVKYVEETKYLGLTLDSRLRWTAHVENKIKSATQLFFMMKKALGTYWGPQPHLIKWVYTGMVRPAITYGSYIWGKVIETKWVRNKFRRINALALRMMAPHRKSTPISSMELITYTQPLDIFIQGEIVTGYFRNKHLLIGPDERVRPKGGHVEYAEDQLALMEIPEQSTWDRGPTQYSLEKGFEVDTDSYLHGKPIKTKDNLTTCYTDGSKTDKGVGAGILIQRHFSSKDTDALTIHEESFSLEPYNTVFQAEVAAIQEAASFLLSQRHNIHMTTETVIMSDSRSSLQALLKIHNRSRQTNQCVHVLNELSKYTKVTLRWIKAHVGHPGNEAADSLAKKGADFDPQKPELTDSIVTELTEIPAPISYMKSIIRNRLDIIWGNQFVNEKNPDSSRKHRQTKHFWTKPNKEKSKVLLKLSRIELGYVFQFITGHARFNRHDHIIALGQDDQDLITVPTCSLCENGDETPIHLIHECDPLSVEARELFGHHRNYLTEGFLLEWSARKLMKFLRLPRMVKLFTKEEHEDQEEDEPPDPDNNQSVDEDEPEAQSSTTAERHANDSGLGMLDIFSRSN